MKATMDTKSVQDLLDLKRASMLYANPEYQRGHVWTTSQRKRLVDSVLRGYPIPLFYLHEVKKTAAGRTNIFYEVIDGQQRIEAIYRYAEGEFKLFDPVVDEEEARYPAFIKDRPCHWGGKHFEELSPELKKQLLEKPLAVVMIETDVPNEARDLFIRLQAGMPLNSQEKRDAWPGNFTEFVLKTGGKPELPRYPGHEFFRKVMKAKDTNRGEYRQLTAQMVMLFLSRRENGDKLCDINRDAIDTFYHRHLDFDPHSGDAERFVEILDLLTDALGDGKRRKVIGHEAIHLMLLVDGLMDDYTRAWMDKLPLAFEHFRLSVAKATAARHETPGEFWQKYGQLTRANSDRADSIQRRHLFFVEKMYGLLKPTLKDPVRIFGHLEKELIYHREKKQCQLPGCGGEVKWDDAEFHHVEEHSAGGRTKIDNGALFHRACHPRSAKAVADFAAHWRTSHSAAAAMGAESETT